MRYSKLIWLLNLIGQIMQNLSILKIYRLLDLQQFRDHLTQNAWQQ